MVPRNQMSSWQKNSFQLPREGHTAQCQNFISASPIIPPTVIRKVSQKGDLPFQVNLIEFLFCILLFFPYQGQSQYKETNGMFLRLRNTGKAQRKDLGVRMYQKEKCKTIQLTSYKTTTVFTHLPIYMHIVIYRLCHRVGGYPKQQSTSLLSDTKMSG